MVILGSIDFDLNRWGRLGKILNIYGEATGTNSQFAFFSPGISSQIRVRFVIKNKDGLLNTVDMINAKDREASLRVGNIFDQFIAIEESDDEDSSDLRRSLAASLAGTMFARHPEAESVTVKIDEYIPSDLHKKNTDAAPAWNTIYEIEFASKERRQ
ncbi:MAG: hypothetical protein NTX25_12635 [Proteobacteria bacterium]|nr:hypothetical protein [Pseudomonadota bacterium]